MTEKKKIFVTEAFTASVKKSGVVEITTRQGVKFSLMEETVFDHRLFKQGDREVALFEEGTIRSLLTSFCRKNELWSFFSYKKDGEERPYKSAGELVSQWAARALWKGYDVRFNELLSQGMRLVDAETEVFFWMAEVYGNRTTTYGWDHTPESAPAEKEKQETTETYSVVPVDQQDAADVSVQIREASEVKYPHAQSNVASSTAQKTTEVTVPWDSMRQHFAEHKRRWSKLSYQEQGELLRKWMRETQPTS